MKAKIIKGILLLVALTETTGVWARELQVSTLNVRWYGLGGTMDGDFGEDETRDGALARFIKEEFAESDVAVFEEIVDVSRFRSEVLGKNWKCASYAHPYEKHQHVLVCYRPNFQLSIEEGDDNYTVEGVAMKKYRPAVYGLLKEDGKPVAHIAGVHLKAGPTFSELRAEQVGILGERLGALAADGVPLVVTGDFNTFDDDEKKLGKVLRETAGRGGFISHSKKYTYRTDRYANRFDQVWTTAEPRMKLQVGGPCNLDMRKEENAAKLKRYYDAISDHCPVTARLDVQ